MIEKNERVVIFRSNGVFDKRHPWILKAYAPQGSQRSLIYADPCQYYGQTDRRPSWFVPKVGTSAWVPTAQISVSQGPPWSKSLGYTTLTGQEVLKIEFAYESPTQWPEYQKDGGDVINNGTGQMDPRSIFLLHHFYYDTLDDGNPISKRDQSSRAYSKWTVGGLLIENTLRGWAVNGKNTIGFAWTSSKASRGLRATSSSS